MTVQTVLVAGAGGRIGQVVVERLRSDGHHVVAASRTIRTGIDRHFSLGSDRSIDELLQWASPTAVVNLAGLIGSACDVDEALTERVNVIGAVRLAEAARAVGARAFIQASTAAVYGTEHRGPLSEDASLDGVGTYALSKAAADRELAERSSHEFTVASLRIFNVIGSQFPGSLVSRLRTATRDEPVGLIGWEQFVRDYISVEDVARSISAVIAAPREKRQGAINVATGVPVSNARLISILQLEGTGVYTIDGDAHSWSWADIGRLRDVGAVPAPLEPA